MQVILLERIAKLGQMGDVVEVKPGFARNYLLPQKKALRATKDNIAVFEEQRAQLVAENASRREAAEARAKTVDGMKLIVIRQASDTGQLYGSVSARDIANAIEEQGIEGVDGRMVQLSRPIKEIGVHKAAVQLHPEVTITVTVNVARTQDEADAQQLRAAEEAQVDAEYIDEEEEIVSATEALEEAQAEAEIEGEDEEAAKAESEEKTGQ